MLPSLACVAAAAASAIAAASGVAVVDQAPRRTVVMERPVRVVPPHRDAFRRTAWSIYYLCARVCWNVVGSPPPSGGQGVVGWVWGCASVAYAKVYFVPSAKDVDWTNGNTYVFVLPMAAGLLVDALFQLPILQCHTEHGNEYTSCWNDDVITQVDLLWVNLSGLVVAFIFTLAFRGVLGIKSCYWSAAVVVHGIVAWLIVKALPFAMEGLCPRSKPR